MQQINEVWDGVVQVLKLPAAGGDAEMVLSLPTASGQADVVWLAAEALATGGDGGVVSLWQLPPAGATASASVPPVRLAEHTDAVTCLGLGGEAARLASGSLDGSGCLGCSGANCSQGGHQCRDGLEQAHPPRHRTSRHARAILRLLTLRPCRGRALRTAACAPRPKTAVRPTTTRRRARASAARKRARSR